VRISRIIAPLLAAAGAQLVPVLQSAAQVPGLYSLPTSDFIWTWGDTNLERRGKGPADVSIKGGEANFNCELNAQMRASSTMSPTDYRQIEQELATRLDFIYAASMAMNDLEYNRVLDWATLDCKEYKAPEKTPEERATREEEAREKMLRELEKRRERQQRNAE
jgi:hypothetical protein